MRSDILNRPCDSGMILLDSNSGALYQCATSEWKMTAAGTPHDPPLVMDANRAVVVSLLLLLVVFAGGLIIGRLTKAWL